MLHEVLIALPSTIAPVTFVRSTLIQSSLSAIRKRELIDRYVAAVDPTCRAALLESMAPEWMPIELATAHYAACDALELTATELRTIGEDVGQSIQGTFLATLLRTARHAGLTPWVPLAQFQRLWSRLMQGGAVGLTKSGPKDCTVEIRGLSLCGYQYFQAGFCGVISAGIRVGAGKAPSVMIAPAHIAGRGQRCIFRCAWV